MAKRKKQGGSLDGKLRYLLRQGEKAFGGNVAEISTIPPEDPSKYWGRAYVAYYSGMTRTDIQNATKTGQDFVEVTPLPPLQVKPWRSRVTLIVGQSTYSNTLYRATVERRVTLRTDTGTISDEPYVFTVDGNTIDELKEEAARIA